MKEIIERRYCLSSMSNAMGLHPNLNQEEEFAIPFAFLPNWDCKPSICSYN